MKAREAKRTALVVERRPDLRRDLAALIGSTYRVQAVGRTDQAFEALRRETFDLLVVGLLDLEADPFGLPATGDSPLREILSHAARFGGRLVLLTDSALTDRGGNTESPTSDVHLKITSLPVSARFLTDWPELDPGWVQAGRNVIS